MSVGLSVSADSVASVDTGDVAALVRAVPEADQGLLPSSLWACTCTSYSVSAVSPPMVVNLPVPLKGWLVKLPVVPIRYCTL